MERKRSTKVLEESAFVIRLLKKSKEDLEQIVQWGHSYDYQLKYSIRAEVLVELAEVLDCGSIGGFGNGASTGISPATLFHRWLWLSQKYWPEGTKGISGLRKFFPDGKKDPK